MSTCAITYLHELHSGAKGYIVGYDRAFRGYVGKLLTMGLSPGTEFTVIQLGTTIRPCLLAVDQILISITKSEMDALCIEMLDD